MKLFTKLASLSVGLAMAVGVGVAVGQKASEVKADELTYKLTIDSSDFNTTSYAANNNEKTSNAVCTTDSTKTYQVKWTSYQVMKNSNKMQWQKSKGYIYNSTNLGTISNVTVTSTAGSFTTHYGTSEQPSSGSSGSGKGFFKTYVHGATGTSSKVEITFTISGGGGETTKYTVTYSAGENGTGSKVYNDVPEGDYTLLSFNELSTVNAESGYTFKNYTVGGVDKNPGDSITLSDNTTITVNFKVISLDTTYVFATNFGTYAKSWTTTYGEKSLQGKTDVGGDYAATITLNRANKQSSGVGSDKPFLASQKSTTTSPIMVFALTEEGYKIKEVTVTFEQRGSATPTFNLYKGSACSGSALDSAVIGTSDSVSTSNLNDKSFSLDCVATNQSNNVGAALVNIYISLEPLSDFGTLDHITITSFPNTIYHVGESYNSTGFAVTAYDGPDEDTANFKDVTESENLVVAIANGYTFDDDDVPGKNINVSYTEDSAKETSFHIDVYALAQYELVTSELSDWSGNYLIVGSKTESEVTTTYAMDGSISTIDVEGNHKVVEPDSNDIIETGQELEFVIAHYSSGYSIQAKNGKYIGWDSSSGNGLTASNTQLVNNISISGSDVTIAGAGGRSINFNIDSKGRFRYYTGGVVKLYKLVTSSEADEFAQTFLGAFTCDASGEDAPTFVIKEGTTYWSWSLLKQAYNALSNNSKEMFRLGVASETGDNIAQALARYDLVVAKYGWENFMSRDITPLNQAGDMSNLSSDSSSYLVIIIVIIASIALDTIVIASKKRKIKK